MRALLLLLGGWAVLRAALWPSPSLLPVFPPQLMAERGLVPAADLALPALQAQAEEQAEQAAPTWQLAPARTIPEPAAKLRTSSRESALAGVASSAGPVAPIPVRHIVGANLLLAAVFSGMEIDHALLSYVQAGGPRPARLSEQSAEQLLPSFAPAAAARFARETAAPRRWSMDAWALWRESDNSPLLSGRPSYGRSQTGAVVRFALAPSSGHAPQAYLRASAALAGAREQEGAVGLSARPLPFIPLRLAGEARLRSSKGGTDTRLAAFAVSEIPLLALPGGTTGEVYVQGGYVTGRDATGFIDGQARITRDLAAGERFRLSAGGGAWGGAQEGAGRLDIGPSASLSISAGGVFARISADYRFRVRGEAEPASGPALTISAGF